MNPDDPKFTAYALDELDLADRAEVEQLLRDDPEALAEVEQTGRIAAQLRRELQAEPSAPLTAEQRTELLAIAGDPDSGGRPTGLVHLPSDLPAGVVKRGYSGWSRPLAVAASIAVLAGATYLAVNSLQLQPAARVASGEAQVHALTKSAVAQEPAAEARRPQPGLIAPSEPVSEGESEQLSRLKDAEEMKTLLAIAPPAPAAALHDELPERAISLDVSKTTTGNLEIAGQPQSSTAEKSQMPFDKKTSEFSVTASPQPGASATPAPWSPRTAVLAGNAGGYSAGLATGLSTDSSRRGGLAINENASDARLFAATSDARRRPAGEALGGAREALKPAKQPKSALELAGIYRRGAALQSADESEVGESNDVLRRMMEKRAKEMEQKANPRAEERSENSNTEAYDAITDNAFLAAGSNPLSTFSIDVDTASYANVRRFLNEQRLPPKGAVRIEELLNYFDYDYPQPEGETPFSASMEVAACPWTPEHRLVRIGLKGREIHPDKRQASNLVFLVDVSGSMQPENKLPLVKKSLRQLVDQLSAEDTVAIAVYAGASGCVLEPTNKKSEMRAALDRLGSGGSTNGAAGIQLAYQLAEKSFIKGGVNRVILATDGDFNVGVTSQSDLVELVEKKAKSGVFLTVLGFGMGNLKDSTLEKLADKGNGNYAYIDTFNEARKVLAEQMSGTLVTIAKDVKIQVEFNPAQVSGYRLIGYENRMLKKEDFNDDTKDAGEIGAGHTVTALYEVVPAGIKIQSAPDVDPLKYQPEEGKRRIRMLNAATTDGEVTEGKTSSELLTLKLRYKAPDGETSKLLEFPLTDEGKSYERSSRDFRFAAAVASFGMLLRDSPHKGKANWNSTLELAIEGKGDDHNGYRAEFVSLIERAKAASR